MQLTIAKQLEAEVIQMNDPHGCRHAVCIAKQTFVIPEQNHGEVVPIEQPWPLFYADVYLGEAGASPTLFESDFVLRKSRCDVILNALAYPPSTTQQEPFTVGLAIGKCQKSAQVYPPTRWHKSLFGWSAQPAGAFKPVGLHYGSTWGGHWPERDKHPAFGVDANPQGLGYAPKHYFTQLEGQMRPQVFYPQERLKHPTDTGLRPCAFTPLSRAHPDRRCFAGTYDQTWYEQTFPLLPADFDERFFQCAPQDQQIDFPQGGERVVLLNIHPHRPKIIFNLPHLPMMMWVQQQSTVHTLEPVIDTLQFDLEKNQFSVVWRASVPIRRQLREIEHVLIGPYSAEQAFKILEGGCEGGCGGGCGGGCTGCGGKEAHQNDTEETALASAEDVVVTYSPHRE